MRHKQRIRNDTRALKANDGDIILVKRGSHLIAGRNLNDLAASLGRTGRGRCILIVVDSFDDLNVLTEEEMGKHGWVRKEEGKETV